MAATASRTPDRNRATQLQEQPVIKIGPLEIRYLVDGTVSGSAMGMFELTVTPGAHVPPAHSHQHNEEIVYVLEGVLRYSVDGERATCGKAIACTRPGVRCTLSAIRMTRPRAL